MDGIVFLVLLVAIGATVVATLGWAVPRLKNEEQGYPLEAQIEAVLIPYLVHAVMAGYRMSERGMDEMQVRLHGVDKAAVAAAVYDLLPAEIGPFPIAVIKAIVSRERFEILVSNAFQQFNLFWDARQARFDALLAEWVERSNGESDTGHDSSHTN